MSAPSKPAAAKGINFGGSLNWGGSFSGANNNPNPAQAITPVQLPQAPAKPVAATAHATALPIISASKPQPLVAPATVQPVSLSSPAKPSGINFAGSFATPFQAKAVAKAAASVTNTDVATVNAPSTANSRQLMRDQQKGGVLSVRSITQFREMTNNFQSEFSTNMRESIDLGKRKIEEFRKQSEKLNKKYTEFADSVLDRAKNPNFAADQQMMDTSVYLNKLVKDVTQVYFDAAEQYFKLQTMMDNRIIEGNKKAIEVIFDQRLKEIELVTKMLTVIQAQEKHELDINLAWHAAMLNAESQRFQQVLDFVQLSAELDQQQFEQGMEVERAKHDQLMEIEESALKKYQAQADVEMQLKAHENDFALANKQLDSQTLYKQWENERELKVIEVQDGQFKQRLGVEERLALTEMALQESVAQRALDLRGQEIQVEKELGIATIDAQKDVAKVQIHAQKDVAIRDSDNRRETAIKTKQIEESGKTKRVLAKEAGQTVRHFKPSPCSIQ